MKLAASTQTVKTILLACALGISPCLALAAPDAQELLRQCETQINKNASAGETAETCLNAEKTIRSVSPNSREHVTVLEKLALLTGYNSKFKKTDGKSYYEQALKAAQLGFGEQSPETLEARMNLAAIANSKENHDWRGAREMYLQVLPILRKQSNGAVSEREKNTLDNIAGTYWSEEDLSPQTYKIADHLQAEKNTLAALREMKLESSFDRMDVGRALLKIGDLEMKSGMLDQAEKDTKEALAVFKAENGGGYTMMAEKQLEKIKAKR